MNSSDRSRGSTSLIARMAGFRFNVLFIDGAAYHPSQALVLPQDSRLIKQPDHFTKTQSY
ncbi:MAG TPA: hypothetical protein V6D03_06300 [Candidatus Caenarcaniphilales bacterium]